MITHSLLILGSSIYSSIVSVSWTSNRLFWEATTGWEDVCAIGVSITTAFKVAALLLCFRTTGSAMAANVLFFEFAELVTSLTVGATAATGVTPLDCFINV